MTNSQSQNGTERIERIHDGENTPVLKTIGEQSKELNGIERSVTCPCGTRRNVRDMFQCFYCEVWFCQDCAEDHFGEGSIDTEAGQEAGQ